MSLNHIGAIKCRKCGSKQAFTFWDSINVQLDPNLKDLLVQGKLTTFVCEKCGLDAHVTYDCLYNDMGKHVAIWLRYSDEQPNTEELKMRETFSTISPGKECRIVRSFPDLIDKIRVFDDEFSDYLIELFKLMTCYREGIDLSTPMYYAGLEQGESGGSELVLILHKDNQLYRRSYPVFQCLEGPEAMMPTLMRHFNTRDKWPQVDRHYLLKALEKAGIVDSGQ